MLEDALGDEDPDLDRLARVRVHGGLIVSALPWTNSIGGAPFGK